MSNKIEAEIKEEQMTAFLNDVLKKVEHEADPDELARLRKLFKKCIPLGRRSYVAAFLTKMLLSEENTRRPSRRSRSEERAERPSKNRAEENSSRTEPEKTEKIEKAPRIVIDESLAATIFIGIGRNRHVYPRDLVGLVASVAGLERERIGNIKVLANYSFVQLFKEDAEKAIAALNGYDYRGRKLSVSYSKQRSDDKDSESEASTESTSSEQESALQATEEVSQTLV